MAKKKNVGESVTITITTHKRNEEILIWLASRGPFGKNPAEVAERFVSDRLQEFLPDEKFVPEEPE